MRADFGVSHPAADVWDRLSSPEGFACVPGAAVIGPDRGTLAFDVEARHLVFEGSAAVASDRRARTVTVEAKGIEQSGRGKGRVTLVLKVEEDGLFSTVQVEADLHLSGELAAMSRLIAEAAYRLADGVAECLDTQLGVAGADVEPAPEAPAAPVHAIPEAAEAETPLAGGPGERAGWIRRLLHRLGGGKAPGPPA